MIPEKNNKKTIKITDIVVICMILLMIMTAIFITGCGTKYQPPEDESIDDAKIEGPGKLIDGPTNITEFKELKRRASTIESYKYNITDTGITDKEFRFVTLQRFLKITLPEIQRHDTGQLYDEILMDKKTKTAFSHCSKYVCQKPEIDKELEKVDFDRYYMMNPMEYLYLVTGGQYVKDEMIGDQYTKVFDAEFNGNKARVWLQEYYGFPLKIFVKQEDGSIRKIIFEDVMIDNTRTGEIDTPFNFTVADEDGNWYFWQHYLGDWPDEGNEINLTSKNEEKPGSTIPKEALRV